MIENISLLDLEKNSQFNDSFFTASFDDNNQSCTYFKGNFYLDSYNYYPITENYKTFDEFFIRIDKKSVSHYYSEVFFKNLQEKINTFKVYDDCTVIGSNPGNNYFSNLIQFLPRIFFENEKQIKIVVHRNLSKKFKFFIEHLYSLRNIKLTFQYLDDDFYKFNNSKIPQFLNTSSSINLLNSIKHIVTKKNQDFEKIYIRREDAYYRTIVNEADLIDKLKKNGFKVISTSQYEILDQINFFINAKVVLSAYGSGLANIVFCNPGTKIYEISPTLDNQYDNYLSNRYYNLCKICNLKYYRFFADSVAINHQNNAAAKYIHKSILKESNFYKNMILKLSEVDEIIKTIQQPTDE